MLNFLGEDPPVLEERGRRLFVPAHPKPHERRPHVVKLMAGARRNLLGIWARSDYKTRCDSISVLGRQIVLVNTPETIKYVLATRHDNFERKAPQMRRALDPLIGDGLFISDGELWRRRRPLVGDIVHKSRLPVFGPTMEGAAGEFTERWLSLPPGTVLDALSEMAELTAEIISRAVFGNRLGHAAAHEVIAGFSDYQDEVDYTNLAYFAGADEGSAVRRSRRLKASIERVHAVVDRVITDHLEGRGDSDSIVDALVRRQQKDPQLQLSREGLRNEAITIFMAGHETTAATLAWAWYLVANSPWAEASVLREVSKVCGDRQPTLADVPNLDYCRAVIEETLRLYPPVPILARQAREADKIGDVEVKASSLVFVVPWLLHRARDLWPRANYFKPERFISGRPVPYSYAPFALGPRICAGLSFGLTEAILCLATIMQKVRVRVPEGTAVEPVCRLTLRPKGGIPITVERR